MPSRPSEPPPVKRITSDEPKRRPVASIASEKHVGPQRPDAEDEDEEEPSEQQTTIDPPEVARAKAEVAVKSPAPPTEQPPPTKQRAIEQPKKSADAVNAARERYLARKRQKTS